MKRILTGQFVCAQIVKLDPLYICFITQIIQPSHLILYMPEQWQRNTHGKKIILEKNNNNLKIKVKKKLSEVEKCCRKVSVGCEAALKHEIKCVKTSQEFITKRPKRG